VLLLLSGPIGAGKTTLCQHLAEQVRGRGLDVGGILAPAVIEGGRKAGIEVVDLGTGERRLLARTDRDLGGVCVGRYSFDACTLAWAVELCARALTTDALVFVDEIGPLELERKQGLASLVPMLAQPRAGTTVVIVRDGLIDALRARVARARPRLVRLESTRRQETRAGMEAILFAPETTRGG
jgi:nucleoside-triphosphatase THEP1